MGARCSLCISYFTIEKRGAIPAEQHSAIGHHIFGCDICQDVCPWNRKTAELKPHEDATRQSVFFSPELADLAGMTEDDFRRVFRGTPVWRTKYRGFLRNVAIAMGNSRQQEFLEPLERLSAHSDATVAGAAKTAHARLREFPATSNPTVFPHFCRILLQEHDSTSFQLDCGHPAGARLLGWARVAWRVRTSLWRGSIHCLPGRKQYGGFAGKPDC